MYQFGTGFSQTLAIFLVTNEIEKFQTAISKILMMTVKLSKS